MTAWIGFTGSPGVGKSTAAEQLKLRLWELSCCAGHEPSLQIVSLADPLKQIARDLFGIPSANLWGPSAMREARLDFTLDQAPHVTTVRGLLQFLGTDIGRDMISSDVWVRALERQVKSRFVLIPDVRFDSEAKWLASHDAYYLCALAFADPAKIDSAKAQAAKHACEGGLSEPMLSEIAEQGRLFRYVRPTGHSHFTLDHMRAALSNVARVIFDGDRFCGECSEAA